MLAALVPSADALAQLLDRGSFRLTVHGNLAGTEEFTIRRTGAGEAQVTLARATIDMSDGRTVTTVMRALGPDLIVEDYSVFVTGPDTQAIRVVRSGDRLRTRVVAPWGEEVSELRARPSTVLLDQGVAHHYFLLTRYIGDTSLPLTVHTVSPLARDGQEVETRIETATEEVSSQGLPTNTVKILLSTDRGQHSAWFDGGGRLVRVEIPSLGFVAERGTGGIGDADNGRGSSWLPVSGGRSGKPFAARLRMDVSCRHRLQAATLHGPASCLGLTQGSGPTHRRR